MESHKKVFVTIGTTKFEKLIEKVSSDEILDILHSLGYKSIQFQFGTGKVAKKNDYSKIKLKYDSYFDNFGAEIEQSDLVISHAGAGTCLEVLQRGKPLIVVINNDLMDNHQEELARQLSANGHLIYCATLDELKGILLEKKFNDLKPYPKADTKIFSEYLDKSMGFELA